MTKEKFTSISLQEEMQRSYLEYAMSVIIGRALPESFNRKFIESFHKLN